MHTSFPISKILRKYLWAFLLATLLVPVLTVFLVRTKTAPKDFEKYELFIGADVTDQGALENDIKAIVPEDKTVTVYYSSEADSLFGTLYQGYSQYSDILILSKGKLDTFTDFSLFVDIKTLNGVNSTSSYNEYGLYFDKTKENLITKYMKFLDDEYFVLLNKNSVHLKELASEGKTNQTKRILSSIGLYMEEEAL